MDTVAINISLPNKILKDAKRYVKMNGYSSLSELIREALRRKLYENKDLQKDLDD